MGDFRQTLDPDIVIDLIYGALYYRLLITGAPSTPTTPTTYSTTSNQPSGRTDDKPIAEPVV